MSAIEYYLQNANFNHLGRASYYESEVDANFRLSEIICDDLATPPQTYSRPVAAAALEKKLFDGGKDDSEKFLNDNFLLKTFEHVDITSNNDQASNSTIYNSNADDFNYSNYNKTTFGFSSYDCKTDSTNFFVPPPGHPSSSTCAYSSSNLSDHFFTPPVYLPYLTDQTSDRPKKRSPTITKKERRRTHSINAAFSALRNCIPNVPSDTKLSKIKTLRLATSYIAFLMNVLDKNDPELAEIGFKADMTSSRRNENREEKRRREAQEILKASMKQADRQPKGRTGWPQQVWASELK